MEMEAGVSGSKKRRSASPRVDDDGGGVDRISNLPDALLGDIISILPTKDGARTQILASRWRHLWRFAPLNIDCSLLGWRKVAQVLPFIISSHQGPGRRFCLPSFYFYTMDDRAVVEACLPSPALDNLQDLELDLHLGLPNKPVPASVFRFSPTLVVFQIGHCILSDVTIQGLHFPLLKHLGLSEVEISDCSLNNMIAGCPALECLMIYCCHRASSLRINSLCLRRIAVTNTLLHKFPLSKNTLDFQNLIIENAPRLETLLLLNESKDLHVSVLFAPKLETLGCNTSTVVFGSQDIQVTAAGSVNSHIPPPLGN
jgi:hypothetical protein